MPRTILRIAVALTAVATPEFCLAGAVGAAATEALAQGSASALGIVTRNTGVPVLGPASAPTAKFLGTGGQGLSINLSPGGLSSSSGLAGNLISANSLPVPASSLPTVTIGVHHTDPTSAKVVTKTLSNLSKIGYNTYGLEMPTAYQPALNAMATTLNSGKGASAAKNAFWESLFGLAKSEAGGNIGIPTSMLETMTLKNFKQNVSYEHMSGLLDRATYAHSLGMTLKAVDGSQTATQLSVEKAQALQIKYAELLSNPNLTLAQRAELVAARNAALKEALVPRNQVIAKNLTPGMVMEVGAYHTDGSGSINSIASGMGKPVISFDAYNAKNTGGLMDIPASGAVLQKAPSTPTLINAINSTPSTSGPLKITNPVLD